MLLYIHIYVYIKILEVFMAYLDPKLVLSPKGKVANIEVIIDKDIRRRIQK